MATLALGLIGGALFPGTGYLIGGAAIGSAIGGFLDSFFIIPTLFPTSSTIGAKLDDLSITVASEGSPMKWIVGPLNRPGGTLIWVPRKEDGKVDFRTTKTTKKVGGLFGFGGQKQTTYKHYVSFAVGLADTVGLTVSRLKKVYAGSQVIYDNEGVVDSLCEEVRFYDGSQTTPDPTIEANKGAGNAPAYIKQAYVVIVELNLTALNMQTIPPISVEFEQDADMSVGDAITLVLRRDDTLSALEFNVDRLDQCFKGMIVSGPQPTEQTLGVIMAAYAITYKLNDGVLEFYTRGTEETYDFNEEDLAAGTNDRPRPMQKDRKTEYDLPDEVDVKFIASDNSLQAGSERQRRRNHPTRNVLSMDLPITLHPEEARALSKQILWSAHSEKSNIEVSFPPRHMDIQSGDVLTGTVDGQDVSILAVNVARGADHRINVSGVSFQRQVYDQTGLAQDPSVGGGTAYRPPATIGFLADLPAMNDDQTSQVGYFYGICTEVIDDSWAGASVFESTDDTDFVEMDAALEEAVMGRTLAALEPGTVLIIDTLNTVEVEMLQGSLTSVTEEDLLQGANWAAIRTGTGEWEIIGFQTATLTEDGTYILSNLLRGLRGTEHLVGEHTANADFLLITDGGIDFVERDNSILSNLRHFRFPARDGNVDDYESSSETCVGNTMRPFAPIDLAGTWDTGDFTGTWTRRGKKMAGPFSPGAGGFSADELPETYEVDFRSGGDNNPVVRTKVVTTNEVEYTAAEQAEDGLTGGVSPINMWVYQISTAVGRGIPAKAILEP